MHTNKDGMLFLDRHQDYFLDGVELLSDAGIAIEFHRKFDTCDNDDYLIDVRLTLLLKYPIEKSLTI